MDNQTATGRAMTAEDSRTYLAWSDSLQRVLSALVLL